VTVAGSGAGLTNSDICLYVPFPLSLACTFDSLDTTTVLRMDTRASNTTTPRTTLAAAGDTAGTTSGATAATTEEAETQVGLLRPGRAGVLGLFG